MAIRYRMGEGYSAARETERQRQGQNQGGREGGREGGGERERERGTDRQTDVFLPPEPPTNIQAVTYGPQVSESDRGRGRGRDIQRERGTERQRDSDGGRDRERDRPGLRQSGTEGKRVTVQRERLSGSDRERDTYINREGGKGGAERDVFLPPEPPTNLQAVAYEPQIPGVLFKVQGSGLCRDTESSST